MPEFWCGRDLLTAFVSWRADTHEDGVVISESCARRLDYPYPVEPGDKISNRHSTKGVVSRILPDAEMPHLPDGTPVELIFSVSGLQTRMNFGQLGEAVASRIARAEGVPIIVPPFHAPGTDELRERLAGAGLPQSGQETLLLGCEGEPLEQPGTVGWVYWGRTAHLVRDKIRVTVGGGERLGQLLQEPEYWILREAGASAKLWERFQALSTERPDAADVASRLAAGEPLSAPPPSPKFADLTRRLTMGGVSVQLLNEKLNFEWQSL